jgi:hypothetical protein
MNNSLDASLYKDKSTDDPDELFSLITIEGTTDLQNQLRN